MRCGTMIAAFDSNVVTTNNRITLPKWIVKEFTVEEGSVLNFYKDEYGRIFIENATTESIFSTIDLSTVKQPIQKVFP